MIDRHEALKCTIREVVGPFFEHEPPACVVRYYPTAGKMNNLTVEYLVQMGDTREYTHLCKCEIAVSDVVYKRIQSEG